MTTESRYKVSVRALADFCQDSGDLISSYRPSPSAFEGQQTHKLTQQKRNEHYKAETSLSFTWQNPTFEIKISGRADGTFPEGVEEIKTTRVNPDELPESARELHRAQAKLYGAMYALSTDTPNDIEIHNTYVHPQTLKEWTFYETINKQELIDFLVNCCIQYESWLSQVHLHHIATQQFTNELKFPFSSMRSAQRQMAESVYKACRLGRNLTIEAPTGTGKTLAAIFPALKSMSGKNIHSLFFLTMKTTGQVAAIEALEQLDPKHELSIVSLAAKNRMCLSSDSPCDGEFCPYAKDYFNKRNKVKHKLFNKTAWTADTLTQLAEENMICPYYLSQDWAIWADVIIGDINYIYDTTAVQPYLLKEIDNQATILIDESHNLIDRGRMIFSTRFYGSELQELIHQCPKAIQKRLRRIQTKLRDTCRGQSAALVYEPPVSLVQTMRDFIAESPVLLRENPTFEPSNLWQEFIFTCARFVRLHELADPGDFCWRFTDGKPDGRKAELICLNPAKLLMSKHNLVNNVVAFSATLKPWTYSNQLNGLQHAITEELPSPFLAEQSQVFIARDISTRFKDRESLPIKLKDTLAKVTNSSKNSMVFFSSYQQLRSCVSALTLPSKCIIQNSDWTNIEREELLKRFKTDSELTLFTVLGGVFSEGIDLPGVQLEQVIIVGPGLPQVNETNNAVRNLMDSQGLPGFDFAYVFPGLQKVLQAAGRCVRTENDVGSIILIDDRFEQYRQNGWLPVHWSIKYGYLSECHEYL